MAGIQTMATPTLTTLAGPCCVHSVSWHKTTGRTSTNWSVFLLNAPVLMTSLKDVYVCALGDPSRRQGPHHLLYPGHLHGVILFSQLDLGHCGHVIWWAAEARSRGGRGGRTGWGHGQWWLNLTYTPWPLQSTDSSTFVFQRDEMVRMGYAENLRQGSPSEFSDDYPPSARPAIEDAHSDTGFNGERRGSRRFSIVDGRGKKVEVRVLSFSVLYSHGSWYDPCIYALPGHHVPAWYPIHP